MQDQMSAEGISPDSAGNGSRTLATLGVIESYNRQRGFGFIRSGVGERLFFHVSAALEGCTVEEGVDVEFDLSASPKGPRAINLRAV